MSGSDGAGWDGMLRKGSDVIHINVGLGAKTGSHVVSQDPTFCVGQTSIFAGILGDSFLASATRPPLIRLVMDVEGMP